MDSEDLAAVALHLYDEPRAALALNNTYLINFST